MDVHDVYMVYPIYSFSARVLLQKKSIYTMYIPLFSYGKNLVVPEEFSRLQIKLRTLRFLFYYSLDNAVKVSEYLLGLFVAQQIANGSTQSCHELPELITESGAGLGGNRPG